MHDIIHDCHLFLLAFFKVVTNAPEQLCASAFIFSPLHSPGRKLFGDIVPQRVTATSRKWSASLQILEGHSNTVEIDSFLI